MWNPFKRKPFNIFDEINMACEKCFKVFPGDMKICPRCGSQLVKRVANPNRDKQKEVQYGDKQGKQISQPVFNKDTNSVELHILDEKYPMRVFPRHHLLHGPLAPLKRYIKNLVIEQLVKCLPFKIPDENLSEPVKELARVFNLLIEAEDEPEMKRLMGQFKDAITMILQEDDAWRYRLQWAAEQLDMKKFKLSEGDKYYFRGKSFNNDFIK